MSRSCWILLAVVTILVFCITFLFWPDKPDATGPFPPGPNVRISSKPFQPIVQNNTQTVNQPTDASIPPTAAPNIIESSTKPPLPSALRIRIVDALGEPVKKGVITLQGNQHTFYGGLFRHEDIPIKSCELVASADEYSSATETFDPSKTGEYSIILEYTSSHGVTIYADKDKKIPCPGAEVYLWKGNAPPRPLRNKTPVLVEGLNQSTPYDTVIIARDHGALRVASIPKKVIPDAQNKYFQGYSLRPFINDLITGVDSCNWGANRWTENRDVMKQALIKYTPMSNPTSPNLRIWDILSLAEKTYSSSWERVMIRFIHEGKECFSHIRMPPVPTERTLIKQGKTDNNGQCIFTGLAPGIYYIQACKASQRSIIAPFLPTQAHTKLSISNSSRVFVNVEKAGLEHVKETFGRAVENAQVSLIPDGNPATKGKGIYSGSTDNTGMVILKPVQWGTYRMKTQIPEEYSASTIIQNVTIENACHNFTVRIDAGFSVSGKVVRKDNNSGVADFPVELMKMYSTNNYIHGVVKTDAEGNFVFTKVYPGTYWLKSYLDYDENMEFAPHPIRFIIGANGALPNIPHLEFVVDDKDVEGLEYPVTPIARTRFTGQVVDENNRPVPGAILTIEDRRGKNPLLVKTLGPQPPTTDEDGKFDLIIPAGVDPEQYEFTFHIVANLIQVIPYTPSGESGFSVLQDKIIPLGQGEIPVTFHIGEEHADLKITLNTSLFTKRINGIIKTEDNGSLDGISVSATQDNFKFPATPSEDGTFVINGVKPGKITLSTFSPWREVEFELLGSKYISEYHNEYFLLDIPSDDSPDLYVEITLKKAGYLTGVVQDSNGIPKQGVWIMTQLPWGKGLTSQAPTGIDGQFLMSGIPLNYTYDLKAFDENSNKILTLVNGVQPSAEGLVIQCP